MKIYYLQNENQEIIEDGFEKFNSACKEKEREDYHIKNGYNGALFFVEYMETDEYKEKAKAFSEQQAIKRLRRQRDEDCFSVINRGALWYERLTDEQKQELEAWYEAWLNVTETKIIPVCPEWLNN